MNAHDSDSKAKRKALEAHARKHEGFKDVSKVKRDGSVVVKFSSSSKNSASASAQKFFCELAPYCEASFSSDEAKVSVKLESVSLCKLNDECLMDSSKNKVTCGEICFCNLNPVVV